MSVEAPEVVLVPPAPQAPRRRRGSRGATLTVVVITVLWLIPTIGLLVTSIRPVWQTKKSGWWNVFSDRDITANNYISVLTGGVELPEGITPYLFNSLAVAIPATFIPIVIACMAAYALAWVPFRGATAVLIVIIALQVIPIQMILLPLLDAFNVGWSVGSFPVLPDLNNPETGRSLLMGTYIPLWIVHTIVSLPIAVFLMHNAISKVPREFLDAAKIDGASHYQIFRLIVLPIAVPGIAAFAIFQFVWVWNDYIVALTYSAGTPDVAPVTRYLAYLSGSLGVNEHLMSAGAFISMLIPVAVFFALQRHYVRSLTG